VAERTDVIIDFKQYAGKTLYIENRWTSPNGQGGRREIGKRAYKRMRRLRTI